MSSTSGDTGLTSIASAYVSVYAGTASVFTVHATTGTSAVRVSCFTIRSRCTPVGKPPILMSVTQRFGRSSRAWASPTPGAVAVDTHIPADPK